MLLVYITTVQQHYSLLISDETLGTTKLKHICELKWSWFLTFRQE